VAPPTRTLVRMLVGPLRMTGVRLAPKPEPESVSNRAVVPSIHAAPKMPGALLLDAGASATSIPPAAPRGDAIPTVAPAEDTNCTVSAPPFSKASSHSLVAGSTTRSSLARSSSAVLRIVPLTTAASAFVLRVNPIAEGWLVAISTCVLVIAIAISEKNVKSVEVRSKVAVPE